MMKPLALLELVPGPVQTKKCARIFGTSMVIGVVRSEPVIVIFTVSALAEILNWNTEHGHDWSERGEYFLHHGLPYKQNSLSACAYREKPCRRHGPSALPLSQREGGPRSGG